MAKPVATVEGLGIFLDDRISLDFPFSRSIEFTGYEMIDLEIDMIDEDVEIFVIIG